MCVTDDDDIAEKLRMLRNHGQLRGEFVVAAGNSRMTEIAAALGLAQLHRLDEIVLRRRELAALYREALGGEMDLQTTPRRRGIQLSNVWAGACRTAKTATRYAPSSGSVVLKPAFFRSPFTSSVVSRGARLRCRSQNTLRRAGSRFRSIRRCETPRLRRWSEASVGCSMSDDVVLEVEGLRKVFHIGFFRKRVEAVNGTSFKVKRGEIFGLLGPNGAGKTTTIKAILRLIFPTEGEIRIFGRSADDPEAAKRVGYMPENPYVYQYLKPLEFLDLCGRLVGLPKADRRARSEEMIDKVGLRHAVDRPIGKFSKGMMQRIGLAQALLHDPELLVLDEPMSGLDPIGRKEVRDLLVEQRERGKTLLFTSHILSDVELLCDRVVIMQHGKITSEGQVHDLLETAGRQVEIRLSGASQALKDSLGSRGTIVDDGAGHLTLRVEGQKAVEEIIRISNAAGARLDAMIPQRQTLENLFVKNAGR